MVYKSAVLRWTVTLLNIFTHEYQNKKLFIDKNLDISKPNYTTSKIKRNVNSN